MNNPDWLDGYVDEVNNGHRFGFYVSQGLDVSDLNQVNELLISDEVYLVKDAINVSTGKKVPPWNRCI
jgi:hypothetical protein